MGKSLCDVTTHYLLVAILQDEDVPTICALSRVSKDFWLAARRALSLVQSVSVTGNDSAWKLAVIRTITRHCTNLRQISAHFVDDLPKEDIARVFSHCRKLRSFRRVPPGVLKSIRVAARRNSDTFNATACYLGQSSSLDTSPIRFAKPSSGDTAEGGARDVDMTRAASTGTGALDACGEHRRAEGVVAPTAAAPPAAPMVVPRSMELLTVDIECNDDLRAICDKFADLKTIQLFNSIHAPLIDATITPVLLKHRHLSFLSLYGFEITDEVFQAISGLAGLQKLSLVDADLDNDDCSKIAVAVSHVNLELLSVSENRDITMDGIVQLAPLTTIGALNIRGTSVGFGALDALSENPMLFPKLVVLMVTQLSLIELTRRTPALKVRYIRA